MEKIKLRLKHTLLMCAISIPLFHDLCSWRNSFKKNINNGFPVVEWLLFVMQYITVATEPLLGKTISAPKRERQNDYKKIFYGNSDRYYTFKLGYSELGEIQSCIYFGYVSQGLAPYSWAQEVLNNFSTFLWDASEIFKFSTSTKENTLTTNSKKAHHGISLVFKNTNRMTAGSLQRQHKG